MQLVDIMSRAARREGCETQRKRLRSYPKTDELHTHPQLYDQVHRLSGLGGCIAEHAVIPRRNGKPINANRKVRLAAACRPDPDIHIFVSNHSHSNVVGHDLWMNRPLPDEYLHYANQDPYLIYSLYNYFARVGYLSLITAEQSMRYISLHRRSLPHREDVYVSHPLLPLGTLGERPIDGPTKTCLSCNRTLSLFGFSPFEAVGQCFVCRAIDTRLQSSGPTWRRQMTKSKGPRISDPISSTSTTLSHDVMAGAAVPDALPASTVPCGYFAVRELSIHLPSMSLGGPSPWINGALAMLCTTGQ
jgi:exonuclease 3'-5' domain-containing protein 1